MKTNSDWAPGPDLRILGAERQGAGWVVTAEAPGPGCCPGCDRPSRCRHGWRVRHLQDLPVTIRDIAQELGLGLRRVQRWGRLIELPARNVMAPKNRPRRLITARIWRGAGPKVFQPATWVTL